jgi:hypothetical protein
MNSGDYVVRHEPFAFYQAVVGNSTFCAEHIVNSSIFNSSVVHGKLGNYSFYTPNLFDDGHTPASASDASRWLQQFLGPILNHTGRYSTASERKLVNQTAFIIVFDEGASNDTGGYRAGGTTIDGGHTYAVIVSPYSVGRAFTANATDYNLESTVEWLFHLHSDGGYDGTGGFPALKGLFNFSSNGY